jgi:predicted NBD/HSP70 family sugar kinase
LVTGDAAYIKKINRSIILKNIFEAEKISRANLSKATALTRATISAQVADLLAEGLIIETEQEHNSVGRKPIMLSINPNAGYALGIDLDYGQITFTISDLLGASIKSKDIEINTTNYSEILSILVSEVKKIKSSFADTLYGIVGTVIAVHGLVSNEDKINFVPRFKWGNIDLKSDLEKELDMTILIENNANLSSFAERVYVHHDTDNLLCLPIHSGIGLGMMMKGDFFQGNDGFAGEIGHMIMVPNGKTCNCGNKGCWEKYASESSIMEQLSNLKQIKNITYEHVRDWLDEGDAEVHKIMEDFIFYLSIGLNNVINIYNPEILVLDSELLGHYPNALTKIKENMNSSISHYREIYLSSFGKKSTILGACAFAIKHFLDIPMLNLPYRV